MLPLLRSPPSGFPTGRQSIAALRSALRPTQRWMLWWTFLPSGSSWQTGCPSCGTRLIPTWLRYRGPQRLISQRMHTCVLVFHPPISRSDDFRVEGIGNEILICVTLCSVRSIDGGGEANRAIMPLALLHLLIQLASSSALINTLPDYLLSAPAPLDPETIEPLHGTIPDEAGRGPRAVLGYVSDKDWAFLEFLSMTHASWLFLSSQSSSHAAASRPPRIDIWAFSHPR
jgi:hypothetical protein